MLLGISVPLIWGFGFILAKAAIDHFPPILLMALRFTVTALALIWFVRPPRGVLVRIFWVALVVCRNKWGSRLMLNGATFRIHGLTVLGII